MSFPIPRLIGLSGVAGVGKDSVADHLTEKYGFVKYSLAAPIKQLLNERFNWRPEQWLDRDWKERRSVQHGGAATEWIIDGKVQGESFTSFSPRSWAQWLGTEVGRNIGGPNVWVDQMERAWFTLSEFSQMVVPDVRFDNEARRIQSLGGVVIRLTRDDVKPVLAHVSEKGVNEEYINATVNGIGGKLDQLYVDVLDALQQLRAGF